MRSPLGVRFPSHLTRLVALALALAAGCTQGTTPPAEQPTPSVSPAPTEVTSAPGANDDPSLEERQGVGIVDRDRKRTVRGTAPAYIEIEEASVIGSIDALRLSVTLAGPVPARMPNPHSILRVTFALTTKAGHRYTFEAQCVRPGWGTFASGGPDDAPIPELTVRGSRLQLTVDPAYIGGLQPFDWLVTAAWTSREANYAFDAAPRKGFASYP